MDSNKLDLVLLELKNICCKIEKNSEEVEARFDKIDKKFEQIDSRLDKMDERFEQIEARLDKMDEKFEENDTKLNNIYTSNLSEHGRIYNMLNCLNSAFLRFEAAQKDKIDFLLEGDKDRKEHQIIYAHEFTRLNDLIAKNSFRISNLEQQSQQN